MALASLSIDLVAKVAQFEQQLKGATAVVESQAKSMANAFGVVETSLKSLGLAAVAGLSFAAVKDKISGVVSAAADLQQLSERTGATVEQLSSLGAVAKLSNTDSESLAAGLQKLSKAMIAVKDDGSDAAQAFAAIGIRAEDLKNKSPAEAFKFLSERLDKYRDGAEKTALAQALLGKSGANLLPVMKDLAVAGEVVAKTTSQQAELADSYEKNMIRLNAAQGAVFKTIGVEALPVMHTFSETLLDWVAGSNKAGGAIKQLAADGTLKAWAEGAGKAIALLVDVVDGLARVVLIAGKGIGAGLAASTLALKGDMTAAKAALAEFNLDREKILGAPSFYRNFVGRLEAGTSAAPALAKQDLNYDGGVGARAASAAAKAAAAMAEAGAKLAQSLFQQEQALAPDFVEKWDKLTAAYRGNRISLEQLTDAQRILLQQQPFEKKATDAALEAAKARQAARNKEYDDIIAFQRDVENADAQFWRDLTAQTSGAQVEAAQKLMTKLRDRYFKANEKGEFEPISATATAEFVERAQILNGQVGLISESVRKLESTWQSVGDNFARGLEDAIVAGKSLRSVIGGLADDILRIAVRQTITAPIGNAISSAFQGFSFSSLFGTLFAGGGVMTPMGPMPLRTYAQGGVASSPQAAIFGEGSTPEAYVPLPDGRRIPVALQGASGGGRPIVVNISNTIGSVASQSDVVLGMRTVRAQIIGELSRQQRLGGGFA